METTTRISTIFTVIIFIISVLAFNVNAQTYSTPESCECKVDTLGLKSYLNTLTLNENAPLKFEVQNSSSTFAVVHGVIGNTTPTVTQTFIDTYLNVTTLVFMQVPGSEDDTANLIAAQKIKTRGYKVYLPAVYAYSQDAFVASGGTDMILAGSVRVIDQNAEVGVHSWSDGTNEATDFPVGHANHLPYINYYVNMGFSQQDAESFYYYTINAAPANNIHHMTEAEIEQYKLRTCTFANSPNYTASANGNILTANLSGATYQWVDCNNGNTPITGATDQSFTPTINGNYAVQVTENSCAGISPCYAVTSLSLLEHDLNNHIKVYPNPSNNNFFIDLSSVNSLTNIQIMTTEGKLVQQHTSSGNEIISLKKNFESGVYFIQVHYKDNKKVFPLVIK